MCRSLGATSANLIQHDQVDGSIAYLLVFGFETTRNCHFSAEKESGQHESFLNANLQPVHPGDGVEVGVERTT